MKLDYEFQVGGSIYDDVNNEEYYDTENFQYEVSDDVAQNAILGIVTNKFFSKFIPESKKEAFISKLREAIDYLVDDASIDEDTTLYDDLKNYFYYDALEEFKNQ